MFLAIHPATKIYYVPSSMYCTPRYKVLFCSFLYIPTICSFLYIGIQCFTMFLPNFQCTPLKGFITYVSSYTSRYWGFICFYAILCSLLCIPASMIYILCFFLYISLLEFVTTLYVHMTLLYTQLLEYPTVCYSYTSRYQDLQCSL
jgi:hypothetical protein